MLLIFQSVTDDKPGYTDASSRDSGRVLINTPADLVVAFMLDEGRATASAVTVTVTSLDGTAIATDETATSLGDGYWKWVLPAHDKVDQLVLVWSATISGETYKATTRAEVVGGFYAPLADIRSADPSLASLTDWTPGKLDAARAEAEDEAERIMGRAFVRRYRRDANLRVDDCGCVTTRMAHVAALRKITATTFGDAVTIAATDCRIVGDSTVWTGLPCGSLVTLDYEHGLDGDVPRGVIGAVKIRARQYVQGSNSRVPLYSERVVIDPNGASVTRMLPGTTRTGVAEVDAVYGRYALGFGIA